MTSKRTGLKDSKRKGRVGKNDVEMETQSEEKNRAGEQAGGSKQRWKVSWGVKVEK